VIGFSRPDRWRSVVCWSSLRTPHSSTTLIGSPPPSKAVSPRLAHHLPLGVAGELEDAVAAGEDAGVAVAGDHAGPGRREVVLERLEQVAEAALGAAHGLMRQP
jgi:hypothetical protein